MTDSGQHLHLYGTVQQLEEENSALRQKLARHEFRQLERELTSARPFRLDVLTTSDPRPEPPPEPPTIPEIEDAMLPRLPVPMGTAFASTPGDDLPVIAVHDDGLTGSRLAAALLGLFKTQYRAPFARLIFLCSGHEAVPLLARYGFIVEVIGRRPPAEVMGRLHGRYGASEIRSLGTGALIVEKTNG
jgi:hypothetical protein